MTIVSLPYQVGAAHAPIDPSPCCQTPFASAGRPKSHLCRSAMGDAMLPAHYESSLVTYAAQSGRRNSLEARARLPQLASRTPPESFGVV